MEILSKLEQWYASRCDGDWEHAYGINIYTLDNPGWTLEVDLIDTPLQGREFEPIRTERTDTDWVHCFIRDGKYFGACGPRNLTELIQRFLDWASIESRAVRLRTWFPWNLARGEVNSGGPLIHTRDSE